MKQLIQIIASLLIPLGFIGLILGSSLFMGHQFNHYFGSAYWHWIFPILTVGSLFAMMMSMVSPRPLLQWLYRISTILVGFLLYLLLSMLVVWLISKMVLLPMHWQAILSIGLALIISLIGIWRSYHPIIREREVPIQNLQAEIRAVLLTDIHLGNFRGQRFLKSVVTLVNRLNPEVIFHTGDLFDARGALQEDILKPFEELNAPHYFIEGNHDNHVGISDVFSLVHLRGITILQNEIVPFKDLQIIGLKHMTPDVQTRDIHAAANGMTIQNVLDQLPIQKEQPSVLLHHAPSGYQYAAEHKINLMLSGHTHAGQMWPLTFIAKRMFGYNRGLYQYGETSIYVSEGIGTMFSPMRVGTRSEITLLKLVPAQNSEP